MFLNISYCFFEDIAVQTEIMNVNFVKVMNIENSIFRKINLNFKKNQRAGNCLSLSNVLSRSIENLIIIDAFSDYKTPGIIIIDNDKNYIFSNEPFTVIE